MVLSGVARTQARFPCGKNVIAQMLCGSNSAKITKLRLNTLSTFGLLKHLTQPEVLLMIDALMALRCLEQVEPEQFRPVVQITEFGTAVMKGKASLAGPLPAPADLLWKLRGRPKADEKSEISNPPPDNRPPDPEILKELKQWRGEIADEAGVPLHYILGNDTLAELASRRPKTSDELLAIKGIGPVKAERYGTTLLEIVGDAEERGEGREEGGEQDEASEPLAVSQPSALHSDDSAPPSSHYWTQRLLQAGFSVDECAAIRGISREAVLEHARRAEQER
jgi:ATP-dependent DNA helicase RecQ